MNKLFLIFLFLLISNYSNSQNLQIFVSPTGNDQNDGLLINYPKRTIPSAIGQIQSIRNASDEKIKIILLPGTYYLESPIEVKAETGPVSIESHQPGTVSIKGSKVITGHWEAFSGNIVKLKTDMAIFPYSQIYIDGVEQILARYPNYDSTASHFDGYAPDAISPDRIKQWSHPEGAIVHAMHSGEWGDFHYVIKEVNKKGEVKLDGGHQNNRPSPMHKKYRMVENVFEELDAPGEWYYDKNELMLYLFPLESTDLSKGLVEVSALNQLFILKGTEKSLIKNISFKGIKFEHTNRTFMETYEPLLRSDWMIYRGGAIVIENGEYCEIFDCEFANLGGNAIFNSGQVRNITIQGNHIYNCGASAISFVGFPSAVRSPSFNYNEFVPMVEIDTFKGPKSDEYPLDCTIDNNLIHDIGKVEKQTAGIQISMAMNITVSHNSIYDVPRAGINVSEGTWGGHIIEYNDVFNTVLETSDHGAFNSWGRDRFWHPNRKMMNKITDENPDMPYWDAIHTTIIRNNRMRCDHGWDIDLDDGSSNYQLYNNLCLNGGIKLREGFYRTVENNILVNNGFHPHVWFKYSGDVFVRNIVMTAHQDIRLEGWGKEVDYNFFPNQESLKKAQQKGVDKNSLYGDPLFLDPEHGDFRVLDNSPALKLGFRNFPMDNFGVQKPKLKRLAKSPKIPALMILNQNNSSTNTVDLLGATFKNIETMGERSAAGLKEISGVLIMNIEEGGLAANCGLQEGDVIIYCEKEKVKNTMDLMSAYQSYNWKGSLDIRIVRNQKEEDILLNTK